MNAPADENKPDDAGDQVEEAAEEVSEAGGGDHMFKEPGRVVDEVSDALDEDTGIAYRMFMWIFTLILLVVVGFLSVRYYLGHSGVSP